MNYILKNVTWWQYPQPPDRRYAACKIKKSRGQTSLCINVSLPNREALIIWKGSATYINDGEGIRKNFTAFGGAMAKMSRME